MKRFVMADLFCGAGGTSCGAVQALRGLGYEPSLTAVNHWEVAVATHAANHPGARHLCTAVDDVDPRKLFPAGGLDLLWASPECTHHSVARGGRPISDQSRATAWCVVRWAEAVLPSVILVENVPEFATWGPLDSKWRPIEKRKGELFRAWLQALQALGYKTDWRLLCAADYGDPTTRKRLFVQAVRGRRKIVWPEPTHAKGQELFSLPRWRAAREIIDWALPSQSIYDRRKPLSEKTMRRIMVGLHKMGLGPYLVKLAHTDERCRSVDQPLPTVVAGNPEWCLCEPSLLPQQSAGQLRSVAEPCPTVATAGAIGLVEPFLVSYYGTGGASSVDDPLDTVTTRDRHALVRPVIELKGSRYQLDIRFRMLQPHELAQAQGFPPGYRFEGTKTERIRQIGNAVPCGLAAALVRAVA